MLIAIRYWWYILGYTWKLLKGNANGCISGCVSGCIVEKVVFFFFFEIKQQQKTVPKIGANNFCAPMACQNKIVSAIAVGN